jgi:peptide/nickel transport system substrate-binding protein
VLPLKKLLLIFQTKRIQWREKKIAKKLNKMHQHDALLVQSLSNQTKLPSGKQLKFISKYLSSTERLFVRILIGIIIISLGALSLNFYWSHSTITPKIGGTYTEGLVGSPHYVNPLFAQASDVDLDLTSLVFSGLLKFSDTGIIKDLAEDYQISADQKVYTFQLRKNVRWHDGEKFTADDVIFTLARINNSKTKSPLLFNFQGINIEKLDDYTIRFILPEPFAPFLESLRVGILPAHIWTNINPENMALAEYNLKPIGCGPYKFQSLIKNKNGTVKNFNLERYPQYHLGAPMIQTLSFKFHDSFEQAVDALNNKNVEGISYLPKELRTRIINNRNLSFHLLAMPQYSAIFFEYTNNPVLKDVNMRKMLSQAVNKDKLVNEVLNAEAQSIDSCILPGALGYNPDITKYSFNIPQVKTDLEKAGWVLTDYIAPKPATASPDSNVTAEEQYPYQVRKYKDRYLEFSLTTVDQPETVRIAKELQKDWQLIGVKVNLIIVNNTKIADIIKNRDYETLLYGQILGNDPDPYPFWHSSQRIYPGLNLTSLNNPAIDKLLDQARKTSNDTERAAKYNEFQKLLAEEVPAIFLFNPTYTYPQTKKIKNFETTKIITPSNRFNEIHTWYIKTERNWTN